MARAVGGRSGTGTGPTTIQNREVGACDAGLVGKVDDHAAIEEVGTGSFAHSGEVVVELGLERVRCDLTVLAAEVSDLTFRRRSRVTGRILAADERIEMGQGIGAVACGINRVDVEMVGCI